MHAISNVERMPASYVRAGPGKILIPRFNA
jgi:hypothetical protein